MPIEASLPTIHLPGPGRRRLAAPDPSLTLILLCGGTGAVGDASLDSMRTLVDHLQTAPLPGTHSCGLHDSGPLHVLVAPG